MTVKKTAPSPFEHEHAPKFTPKGEGGSAPSDSPAGAAKAEIKAAKSGKIVKVSAVVGQQVEKGKTVLFEMECNEAEAAAEGAGGGGLP